LGIFGWWFIEKYRDLFVCIVYTCTNTFDNYYPSLPYSKFSSSSLDTRSYPDMSIIPFHSPFANIFSELIFRANPWLPFLVRFLENLCDQFYILLCISDVPSPSLHPLYQASIYKRWKPCRSILILLKSSKINFFFSIIKFLSWWK